VPNKMAGLHFCQWNALQASIGIQILTVEGQTASSSPDMRLRCFDQVATSLTFPFQHAHERRSMHRCVGNLSPAAPPPSSSLPARGVLGLLSPRAGTVAWRRSRAPPARVTGPSVSGRLPSRGYPPSLQRNVSLRRGGDGAGQGAGMYGDTTTSQYVQSRRGLWARGALQEQNRDKTAIRDPRTGTVGRGPNRDKTAICRTFIGPQSPSAGPSDDEKEVCRPCLQPKCADYSHARSLR